MTDFTPPDNEIVQPLHHHFPGRELQIDQLACLLWPTAPSPKVIVVHGLEATGKTSIVRGLLQTLAVSHTIIKSPECITARHLLERTVADVEESLIAEAEEGDIKSAPGTNRCENLSMLVGHLQRLFQSRSRRRKGRSKFVLVFDDVDRQRETSATFFPALARVGEMWFHRPGIPYVHFSSYTKRQALAIMEMNPLPIFSQKDPSSSSPLQPSIAAAITAGEEESSADNIWLWSRFCDVVWDTLAQGAARDLASFRRACELIWPAFVQPIRDGVYAPRDFSRLMVAKRALFQDEAVLLPTVVVGGRPGNGLAQESDGQLRASTSGYLASYNPARLDPIFFMRVSEMKKRRRRTGKAVGGREVRKRHRKIPRHLLGPSPFVMERLLAIFHAILPDPFPCGKTYPSGDIQTQIATLSSLHLLHNNISSGSGSGGKRGDVLDATTKYRINNVSWEAISSLARTVDLEVADYLAD